MDKYNEYRPNLPEETTTEVIIEGGNHAGFGDYGVQDGDGEASLSGEEQRKITVEAVMEILQEE
jgi:hypothetical protein